MFMLDRRTWLSNTAGQCKAQETRASCWANRSHLSIQIGVSVWRWRAEQVWFPPWETSRMKVPPTRLFMCQTNWFIGGRGIVSSYMPSFPRPVNKRDVFVSLPLSKLRDVKRERAACIEASGENQSWLELEAGRSQSPCWQLVDWLPSLTGIDDMVNRLPLAGQTHSLAL